MEWADEELVASWTLVGEDWKLVGNKTGATRLGFAVLLKFFEIGARFPRAAEEVPSAAVRYLAEQLKVDPEVFTGYDWSGRRSSTSTSSPPCWRTLSTSPRWTQTSSTSCSTPAATAPWKTSPSMRPPVPC